MYALGFLLSSILASIFIHQLLSQSGRLGLRVNLKIYFKPFNLKILSYFKDKLIKNVSIHYEHTLLNLMILSSFGLKFCLLTKKSIILKQKLTNFYQINIFYPLILK